MKKTPKLLLMVLILLVLVCLCLLVRSCDDDTPPAQNQVIYDASDIDGDSVTALTVENENGTFIMSSRDMCTIRHIPELIEAGVMSFKIEGRMKRPEYVAAAVSLVRAGLSGAQNKEILELSQDIFSRSGFTNGYAMGKRNLSMFGYRTKEDVLLAKESLSAVENTYKNISASKSWTGGLVIYVVRKKRKNFLGSMALFCLR